MPASLIDEIAVERVGVTGKITVEDIVKKIPIIQQISGRWLLDPNEINGWGQHGMFDNTNSADLGNVGDLTPSRLAGGPVYPFDVRLKRFYAWHRNSNGAALPWGWLIFRQEKIIDTTAQSAVYILDETGDNGGAGPRDYGNNNTQLTDITFTDVIIPAGELINLSVTSPTAVATNYYAEVMSGYLEFERV